MLRIEQEHVACIEQEHRVNMALGLRFEQEHVFLYESDLSYMRY